MKKHTLLKLLISIFVLIALLGCANTQAVKQSSQAGDTPVLTSVRVDENGLIIKSDKQFTYKLNKTSDPYRATVEIPDMNAGSFTDKIVFDSGMVTEVLPQQIDAPIRMTRLDIVMQSPSSLTPEYKENTLILSIKKDEPMIFDEAKTPEADDPRPLVRFVSVETPAEKEATPVSSRATEITGITIKKSADTVKVMISGNGTMIPNVFPVNERIVVDIPETVLRTALPSQTISPLKGIRAGKHKDKLRIVLDLKEKTNFDVTAVGSTIEISLMNKDDSQPQRASLNATREAPAAVASASVAPAAVVKEAPEPMTEGVYTGKKISLDFQDADIIPIFRLLGDVSEYNIVVNPEVKGKITLKLINVPWDQALDIIMRTFHLSKVVDGNIIRILPTAAVAKELDEIKINKKAQSEAGDLITKILPVNYAELGKLRDAIDKAKLMSSRGSLSLDERGSSIIVNDLEVNIEKITALIREIDQEFMQARQVMIEAKIVEVTSTYTKDLGIQWSGFLTKANAQGTGIISGTGGGTANSLLANLVNLPAAAATGNIGFGFINRAGTMALDLKLSAMEQLLKGKVMSNPKIVTMNNQEAKITQGSTLYLQSTASGSNVASFTAVDANLSLTVRPRIAPGGAVFMDLDITKDQPGPPVGGNTQVFKNTAKTSVLVNNEETVVIGGIFKTERTVSDDSIPGLSRLPLIGKSLFNREQNTDNSTELLIFITPRIIEFNKLN